MKNWGEWKAMRKCRTIGKSLNTAGLQNIKSAYLLTMPLVDFPCYAGVGSRSSERRDLSLWLQGNTDHPAAAEGTCWLHQHGVFLQHVYMFPSLHIYSVLLLDSDFRCKYWSPKLLALSASKPRQPFTWSLPWSFMCSSYHLSWALYLPGNTCGILSLESLLSAHLLSFLVLISSSPVVLVPWAPLFSGFLLPPSSFSIYGVSTGIHATVILLASWFPHCELVL